LQDIEAHGNISGDYNQWYNGPEEIGHVLKANIDNKDYDWKDDNKTDVMPSKKQKRYNETKTLSKTYIDSFKDDTNYEPTIY